MSFKTLIVDDEPIIGRGLSLTIPWEEHGIEIAGIAYDGEEALEKIQAFGDIDIVITDVRMPKVDGIQLSTYLSQHYPQIKIVIISGYDEFKYAQKAIQLGVQDYLLKPVDVEELLSVIRRITNDLQEQRSKSQKVQRTHLANVIYHQVFNVPLKTNEESQPIETVRIYPFLSVLNEYVSTTHHMTPGELDKLNSNWQTLVETHLQSKGLDSISVFTNKNTLLTCVVDRKGLLSPGEMVSVVKALTFNPTFSLSFVMHHQVIVINDLSRVFLTLTDQVKFLPFTHEGLICLPDEETFRKAIRNYPTEIESNLINTIFQVSKSDIYGQINQLFDELESEQFFLEEVVQVGKNILINILNRFESLFRKSPIEIKLHFNQTVDVVLYNSFDELKELFKNDIEKVIKQLDLKNIENKDWLIERAEEYIRTYYTSNIRAHEVADYINISPNYFSTLFKQKTEKSFNEYINELRVEKAKILLEETPFKVNEIAEKVGYQEYKYFVEIFKKLSGLTPTQFRKLLSSK